MNIVHVCLCGPMTDGLSYQENVLSKYHKRMGNDVTIIASKQCWDDSGNIIEVSECDYINNDGVRIIRLKNTSGVINYRFRRFPDLYNQLLKCEPDVLFIHDCQFLDIITLAKFAKHHSMVKVYVDNHADFSNSASNWISKNVLHKIIWKYCVKKIEPYTSCFYGVLPARVGFLVNMYGLPRSKCELLVMGADDEFVKKALAPNCIKKQKEKYGLQGKNFIIVTGGKINSYRKEVLTLMKIFNQINLDNTMLVIFGTVSEDIKDDFYKLCQNENIKYIGWLESSETYSVMAIADLIVFPGLHSVMWEQAVALGKPCVFKNIEGFHHVDLGGNAEFVDTTNGDDLKNILLNIINDKKKLKSMCEYAEEKGKKYFSYKQIAQKSIRL